MTDNLRIANEIARANKDTFQHRWTQDTNASLAAKIDETIGFWPVSAKYLVFAHSDKREMEFAGPGFYRNGWWTDVLTQTEYYAEKLGIQNIKSYEDAIKAMENAQQMAKHAASLIRGIAWPDPTSETSAK